jgi:hypothetical protein
METSETSEHTEPGRRISRLRRAGPPVDRRIVDGARQALDSTRRLAGDGLRLARHRARRHDSVGDATYRALELLSDGLGAASRALGQLGEATRPPARGGKATGGTATGAGRRPASRRTTA